MSPLLRSPLFALLFVASAAPAAAFPGGTLDRPPSAPLFGPDQLDVGKPTERMSLGIGLPVIGVDVSVAGDVDANGSSDWLTGTPFYAPVGPLSAVGRVVVTRRAADGSTLATKTYDGSGESAYFGCSVASVGDINGDGYDDIAIGSPGHNGGAGRIYVYRGSVTGSGNGAWTVDGAAGSFLGYKVAYAGDVNGDGYDDLLAAAPMASDGVSQNGAAYCYLGGPNGLAATPVRTWTGEIAFERLGWGIAGGGDVNADGYADVVLGSPGYGNAKGEESEGRVQLFLGGPSGPASTSAWSYETNTPSDYVGQAIAMPGDANGDGYGDIALGISLADYGGTDNGRFMLFGGGPFLFFLPLLHDRPGPDPSIGFGFDVAPAGDQNGDGFADVVVGAPFGGAGSDGAWLVVYGSPVLQSFDSVLGFIGDAGTSAGLSVSGGGDRGDGVPELLIGYFVPFPEFGAGDGAPALAGGPAPGPNVEVARGLNFHDIGYFVSRKFAQGIGETGFGVSCVMLDINGDGYDDAVVGGSNYTDPDGGMGIVRAYYGDDDGFGDAPFLFSGAAGTLGEDFPPSWNTADWSYVAHNGDGNFAFSLANAGDVNGDGYEDLLVGSPGASLQFTAGGATYLFYGGPDGFGTQPDWQSQGLDNLQLHGYSVAAAGDINQDGYGDVLIGSPQAQVGPSIGAGRIGLYYGSALGLVHVPAREWVGAAQDQYVGLGGTGIGDVDGDGYPDIVISDPGYANGQVREGRIRVYRGGAAGLEANPYFAWESNVADARIGWFCRNAGDLNGDGFADFMIGNPFWSNPEVEEGAVQVFLGGPSTISVASRIESDLAESHLGFALSTAGDLNADGYSDIIVGAPDQQEPKPAPGVPTAAAPAARWLLLPDGSAEPAGVPKDGAAYVHFGHPTGVETSWRYRFNVSSVNLSGSVGQAVAGGGDLNGDGWPDVLYTAPFADGVKVSDNGVVSAALSNVVIDGVAKPRRLLRSDGATPIVTGGRSDSPNSFRLAGLGRNPGGRGKARMQWQAKPPGAALDATGIQSSNVLRTGVPTEELGSSANYTGTATGLVLGERYRVRTRFATRNPYFPRTPWFTSARNGVREDDLRTFGPTGSVAVGDDAVAHGVTFASPWPNPLAGSGPATLTFALPTAGRVTIDAFDAQGRRVARIHDADAPAGRSAVSWSGAGDDGRALPRGLYFLRLGFGDEVKTVKAVVAR